MTYHAIIITTIIDFPAIVRQPIGNLGPIRFQRARPWSLIASCRGVRDFLLVSGLLDLPWYVLFSFTSCEEGVGNT